MGLVSCKPWFDAAFISSSLLGYVQLDGTPAMIPRHRSVVRQDPSNENIQRTLQ